MPINLTASSINALPRKADRYDVTDRKERGLTLRVYPSGDKVFRYRIRDGSAGASHIVTIGPFSETARHGYVTLAQARARIEELRAARRAGPDTVAEVEKRIDLQIAPVPAASVGKTVCSIAAEWWAVLDGRRKRGHSEAEPIFRKHIEPVIGGLTLAEVKKSHCSDIVDRAVAGGAKVHAAKVLAITKQLLDFAGRKFGDDDFVSPAARLSAIDFGVRSNRRKRWLSETELPAFWKALDAGDRADDQGGHDLERRKMAAALRLLLLTALRTSELRLAQWAHFDEKDATLTIVVANQKLTKAQAEHAQDFVVPLPPLALSLLVELRELASGSPWILPGSRGGAPLEEKSIGRYMRGLFVGEPKRKVKPHPALVKLEPATPHDLRRTARTWFAKLGVPPHVSERCLNHSFGGRVLQTYERHDYRDERRAALTEWERTIRRLLRG